MTQTLLGILVEEETMTAVQESTDPVDTIELQNVVASRVGTPQYSDRWSIGWTSLQKRSATLSRPLVDQPVRRGTAVAFRRDR